jgi:hypothetical protein
METVLALAGLAIALLLTGMIAILTKLMRGRWPVLRNLPGYETVHSDVGASVEAGTRVHMALGEGQIIGVGAEAELAGLAALGKIAQAASVSDRPPVATSSDGVTALLAQNVMYSTYRQMRVEERFDHDLGRIVGLGPAGYTAGAMITPREERVSATFLLGAMGAEAALIADTGAQHGSVSAAVTDPVGQAAVFATTDNPLLGEELFAAGAYLKVNHAHAASLQAQDVLRWLAIGAILLGALGSTFLGLFS